MTRRCALLGLLLLTGCYGLLRAEPLPVAESVELERYLGTWYEIASLPQRFQRGCVGTVAHYSQRDDGRLNVVNECRDGSLDGELRRVEGVAWVAEPQRSQARLKVQFFWPFHADYWIVEIGPEYDYAVVGHPSRRYLWILARHPDLDAAILQPLLGRLTAHGFAVEDLAWTRHLY